MARIEVEYFSNALVRPITIRVVIPNDPRLDIPRAENPYLARPMKTVFNLPGYTGGASWGDEMTAAKYNTAFVSVYGENAFYVDNASPSGRYAKFIGEEAVDYVRKTFGLATRREDTYITGISMGGYGALRTALANPETFGKTAGQSAALIIHSIAHMKPGEDRRGRQYDHYHYLFGDLDTIEESSANPEYLASKILEEGRPMPEIYFCCGSEDSLCEGNRTFDKFLTEKGIAHLYEESPGGHDVVFWNEYTPKVMKWLLED
ncbi:MAG: esterase [Lachnospiraceae bacterium]|nr:esterase [Lachnospiraceae bacterium]